MENKQVLAKRLRPKSFRQMHGQDNITSAIRKMVIEGTVPNFMFIGETGSGKTTIARIVAASLNCRHKPIEMFGSYCKKCAKHPSVNVAELNAAKYRKVEDAAKLAEASDYAPIPPDKYRIFIVDEMHRMSKEAQSLLLKYTEDPPETSKWIACTNVPEAIDPALRGRFTASFRMNSLFHKEAETFLEWAAEEAGITRPLEEFFEFVHTNKVSSPRVLLNALERYAAGLDPDKALETAEGKVNTIAIYKGLIAGQWSHVRPELEKCPLEDAALLKASLLGLLRKELLNRTASIQRKSLVNAIEELSSIPLYLDDSSKYSLLCARLYTLSQEKF